MNGSTNTGSAELGFLLHDVARLMRKRFEQHARGFGLTRAQWQALAYLSRNEGISQTGLADLLDVEPITLSRIVDRLVESGFVDRIPHATDRRVWRLRLTDAAKPKLKQVRELGERTRSETLAGLSHPIASVFCSRCPRCGRTSRPPATRG